MSDESRLARPKTPSLAPGAPSRESRQPDHEQRRVRFPGGPEIGIDPEMQPQRARAEPDTTAYRQVRWFGFLGKTQNIAVERPRLRLLPGGHGQLHVIEGENLTHKLIDLTPRNSAACTPLTAALSDRALT